MYNFNIDFRTDLVFWTNVTRTPVASAVDPANRLYSTVQTNTWQIRLQLNFEMATATGTLVGPVPSHAIVTLSKDPNPTRLAAPVEAAGLETRAPISLRVLATDAQT